jgi:hypothetical protein
MSSMNDKRNQFRLLRADYDLSFRRWEDEVRGLELLTSQPNADARAVERVQRRVEEAQNAYRESRNLLAQFLVSALGISSDHSASERAAVLHSENSVTEGVGRLKQRLEPARERNAFDEDCARVEQLVR